MPRQASSRTRARFGVQRFSSVELLAALILLFIVTPFVEDMPQGDFVEACITSLVFVSALLAVGGRRRTLAAGTVLLVLALIGKLLYHLTPQWTPSHYLYPALGLVFIAFVVMQLLRFVLQASHVDAEVLCAGVSGYLMLGLLWMMAYLLVGRFLPNAYSFSGGANHEMDGFNALYFSFSTLSTVGYGDIAPVSKVARMLAVLESVTGTFYVTMLIARLVAVYSPRGRHDSPSDPE